MANPRSKWEDDVCKDAVDLHQTFKWKAGGWTEGWRKKTREVTAQQARWPQKKTHHQTSYKYSCVTPLQNFNKI